VTDIDAVDEGHEYSSMMKGTMRSAASRNTRVSSSSSSATSVSSPLFYLRSNQAVATVCSKAGLKVRTKLRLKDA
jgi:hypothetical protein